MIVFVRFNEVFVSVISERLAIKNDTLYPFVERLFAIVGAESLIKRIAQLI